MIPVPKTLDEAIAKLMEVVSYLETEDARRAAWENDVEADLADMEDSIASLEGRLYQLEVNDD